MRKLPESRPGDIIPGFPRLSFRVRVTIATFYAVSIGTVIILFLEWLGGA